MISEIEESNADLISVSVASNSKSASGQTLISFNKSIEEAAQDLGAVPNSVIWKVTLPVILPSIISGWLLAFTLSLDDLVVASFTTGPGANTLPIVVFSKVRMGLSPEVNALSAVIMLAIVSIAIGYYIKTRNKSDVN